MRYDTGVHCVLLGGVHPQHGGTLSLQHGIGKVQFVNRIYAPQTQLSTCSSKCQD